MSTRGSSDGARVGEELGRVWEERGQNGTARYIHSKLLDGTELYQTNIQNRGSSRLQHNPHSIS